MMNLWHTTRAFHGYKDVLQHTWLVSWTRRDLSSKILIKLNAETEVSSLPFISKWGEKVHLEWKEKPSSYFCLMWAPCNAIDFCQLHNKLLCRLKRKCSFYLGSNSILKHLTLRTELNLKQHPPLIVTYIGIKGKKKVLLWVINGPEDPSQHSL